MSKKTFLQLEKGDILYYVTVKDSKLVNRDEINVVKIENIEKCEDIPYMLTIKLQGQENPILLNWNCYVEEVKLEEEKPRKYVSSFNFVVYSTDPNECARYIKEKNKRAIDAYIQKELELSQQANEIHQEVVKLSGIKIMAPLLKIKKVEELTTDVVYV